MGFFRRKSLASEDVKQVEQESKQRNRLSKPLTKKSLVNLQATLSQDAALSTRSLNKPVSDLPSPSLKDMESREEMISQIFGPDDGLVMKTSSLALRNGNTSVSSLVNRLETQNMAASTSQVSLLSQKKARPMSSFLGTGKTPNYRKNSLRTQRSNEPLRERINDVSSPLVSRDQLVEDQAPRPRRQASFKPGAATRIPSNQSSIECSPEAKDSTMDQEVTLPAPQPLRKVVTNDDPEEWSPPQRVTRSETPADLDYTHLGGLRLGSLHIVNGRASPAASMLSKHMRKNTPLRLMQDRRYASSHYGDSEDGTDAAQWEDEELPADDDTPERKVSRPIDMSENRQFSFESTQDVKLSMDEKLKSLGPITPPRPQTPTRQDQTASMADAYIAELPPSPYAPSTPSSTGSVRRYEDKANAPRSFVEDRRESAESEAESGASYYSAIDPIGDQDDAFESAVEIQSQPSPKKPRPTLPQRPSKKTDSGYGSITSLRNMAQKQEKFGPTLHQHEEDVRQYPNSVDEVLSTPAKKDHTRSGRASLVYNACEIQSSAAFFDHADSLNDMTASREDIRTPVRKPAAVNEREYVNAQKDFVEPSMFSASVTSFTPSNNAEPITPVAERPIKVDNKAVKSSKARKKLQKARPKSITGTSKGIFVQRASSDGMENVPPVSPDASQQLAIRSETLPELERTFKSQNTVKNQASISVLSLFSNEVRFPSPAPEAQKTSGRSRIRPKTANGERSKSRPRTWFGWPKTLDNDQQRETANARDEAPKINDFGDVTTILGESPYDAAAGDSRPQSRHSAKNVPQLSPHSVSVRTPRPKSTMDDQTAIQVARRRSRSIQEKGSMQSRRSSFNDRGGIPGKNLRASSFKEDAPPLPPMPNREEIERRFSRHHPSGTMSLHNTPQSNRGYWSDNLSSEPASSPAPPPPLHSPRPEYVRPYEEVYEFEDEQDEPPPPPCHSPRPRDITPQPPRHSPQPRSISLESETMDFNVWEAQARAWRAKRQSAGQRLQEAAYYENDVYQHEYEQPMGEEPLYPEIPMRNGSTWRSSRAIDQPMSRPGEEEDYQQALREYFGHQNPSPRRPLPNPESSNGSYSQEHYQYHERSYENSVSQPSSRPYSRTSRLSAVSSLAEELHPADLQRKSPAPDYGRYSGGFEFGYEGRERGFGGSAGTRSVSGKADAKRKSGASMNDFGLDFSDIPPMSVPVGATGSKMKYEYYD